MTPLSAMAIFLGIFVTCMLIWIIKASDKKDIKTA